MRDLIKQVIKSKILFFQGGQEGKFKNSKYFLAYTSGFLTASLINSLGKSGQHLGNNDTQFSENNTADNDASKSSPLDSLALKGHLPY